MTLWVASVSLCVGASQGNPLSVLARNPHKGLAREISHETGRTREGRSQGSVDRRGQSREGDSQQNGAAKTSRQNRSVKRWEQDRDETTQQKSETRLLWPVDLQMPVWPTQEDKSAFLEAYGSFAQIHARDSLQMRGEWHKSVTDFPPLRLELT